MYIYVLFIIIVIILLLNYQLLRNDFLSSSNVMNITFLLSALLAIFNKSKWKYEISDYTVLLISTCLIITSIVNGLFHYHFSKKRSAIEIKQQNKKLTCISDGWQLIFVVIMALCVIFRINYIIRVTGSTNIIKNMISFRQEISYSVNDYSMNAFQEEILRVSLPIVLICLFDLIYFWNESKLEHKIMDIISIILWAFSSLLSSGRYELTSVIIASVLMIYLFSKKFQNVKRVKLSSLIKLLIAIIFAAYLLYLLAGLVGRSVSNRNFIDYITSYFGTEIVNFDAFLKNPPAESKIFGKETFYLMNQWLINRKLIDAQPYLIHLEFRYFNGYGTGNTYTALRSYYYDFGVIGMYLLHTIYSIIISYTYEKTRTTRNCWQVIALSLIYYSCALYIFNNSFYSNTINMSFLIRFIEAYLLYQIVIAKRVKFVINRA